MSKKDSATTTAKSDAPRLSKIERLQLELAEAQAKEQAKAQKQIDLLLVRRQNTLASMSKAAERLAKIDDELLGLGYVVEEMDAAVTGDDTVTSDEPVYVEPELVDA